MIEIRNISKSFTDGEGQRNPIFKNLSLTIESGEFVAITGQSGCGKTTLLNMIGGLERPDEGDVLIDNTAMNKLTAYERARFLNRHVGFIFQTHYLLPEQTALTNVMLPMRIGGRPSRMARERGTELLAQLKLQDKLNSYPPKMSGGQCQRVAIARALANKPEVLLADEPTASLDFKFKQEVLDGLLELSSKEGATVVMVTHEVNLIAPVPRIRRIDVETLKGTTDQQQPAALGGVA
jgi:lipoprotein-releasing system ATP-binding protein